MEFCGMEVCKREFCGRRVIYTDYPEVTFENVIDVLDNTIGDHSANRSEIEYLYHYYKGRQPILRRKKDYNAHINNKVLVNRANEIVSFKSGYLMGEPVQYTARKEQSADNLTILNDYCYEEGKALKDKELATWFYICGTAFRMVLPDVEGEDEDDECPFEIYTLDPRNTYVVYYSGLGHKPLAGITYVERVDGSIVYSVYTKDMYFEIENNAIVNFAPHYLGSVPIIEYPANSARLGSFEIVLSMLDAINTVESNRIDGIEQFIQALMIFKGVDVDNNAFASLKELGAIKVPLEGDVSYLIQELNQAQTQTVIDDMYKTVLTICGMPSQGDGSTSDSSNNGAMIVKNGWQQAEARAMESEMMFKESERVFLKLALKICNNLRNTNFKPTDVDIKFTRRNYENILQKSQVLISMLSNTKIHPRLAFIHCGLFTDPEEAYKLSESYAEEQQEKALELAQATAQNGDEETDEETDENASNNQNENTSEKEDKDVIDEE